MEGPDPRRAGVFGRYAADHDRWRPSYPDTAVDGVLPPGATRVADVGAGTGKLTRALLARGLAVAACARRAVRSPPRRRPGGPASRASR